MNNAARTDAASVECSGTSEDPLCGLHDRIQSNIRLNLLVLAVASAKENRPAPGASASFHIAPPVSHHETPSEVDPTIMRRGGQQPRGRLAARTEVIVVVVAHAKFVVGMARLHVMRGQAVNVTAETNPASVIPQCLFCAARATSLSGVRALASALADELIIESESDDVGISIITRVNGTGKGGTGRIYFGDSTDGGAGQIQYSHGDRTMEMRTEGALRFLIDGDGNFRMGPPLPSQAVPDINNEVRVEIIASLDVFGEPDGTAAMHIVDGSEKKGFLFANLDDNGEAKWTDPCSYRGITGYEGSSGTVNCTNANAALVMEDGNLTVNMGGICATSDGACVPTAGAISAESHTTANSDLAEVYPSDELLEEGDVVVMQNWYQPNGAQPMPTSDDVDRLRTELAAAKQSLPELSDEMAAMRTILASLPDLQQLAEDAVEAAAVAQQEQ